MLFGHTRYKKSKKTLPLSRNRHVKLSWNRKNPHRQRVLDLSPPPLDDACSTYIHACSTYIHAQHTYIHAQHTYIHAQHTCIHTYLLNSCAAYICMYLCMYACMYVSKHVCMYVCMFETVNHHPRAGSDSSRKTFSIERFIQFFEICEGGYFQMP